MEATKVMTTEQRPPPPIEHTPRYHDVVWTPERVGRLWGFYANSPAHAGTYFSLNFGADIIAHIHSLNIQLNGARVVDFGCGPGFLLEQLLSKYKPCRAWGVEFSEESAERTRQRVGHFPSFRGVITAKSLPVDLPEACCDILFLVEVFEHLDQNTLVSTVREARRLIRPGGHIVVTTPNSENLDTAKTACPECGCVFHIWQHVRSWNSHSLAVFLENEAGMKTIESTPVLWNRTDSVGLINWLRRLRGTFLRYVQRTQLPSLIYVGQRI